MEKNKIAIPLDLTDKKQGFSTLLMGIALALILGVLASLLSWGTSWLWLLLALGVVVGISNLFHKESVLFIVAVLTATLMLNLLAGMALFPAWAATLFKAVVCVLAPAAVLVSLKVLYALAIK